MLIPQLLARAVDGETAIDDAPVSERAAATISRLGLAVTAWQCVRAGQLSLDPAVRTQLQAAAMMQAAIGQQQQRVLAELLEDCSAAGVTPVLIKGAATAAMLPVPARRTMSDIDLLVDETELDAVHAVMLGRGFSQHSDMPDAFYIHHQHVKPYFAADSGVCVEVHRGLLSRDHPLARIELMSPRAWLDGAPQHPRLDQARCLPLPVALVYTVAHMCTGLIPTAWVHGLIDIGVLLADPRVADCRDQIRAVQRDHRGFAARWSVVQSSCAELGWQGMEGLSCPLDWPTRQAHARLGRIARQCVMDAEGGYEQGDWRDLQWQALMADAPGWRLWAGLIANVIAPPRSRDGAIMVYQWRRLSRWLARRWAS